MSIRDEFVQKMHLQLDKLNAEIDSLEARTDKAKSDTKAEYLKTVESLRSKRDNARERLQKLKEASGDAWSDMKDGVEAAWESLDAAIQSAKSHFK